MRVLLLNPPFTRPLSRASRGPAVGRSGTLYYPYWLAYATGVLEEDGAEVRLRDAVARGLSCATVVAEARDFQPQLIVLDTSTPTMAVDERTAAALKDATGAFLVAVGPHVTALPAEALRSGTAFDAVARGEYDYTLRDLARTLAASGDLADVAGLSYRAAQRIRHNPQRGYIENLDELPFVSAVYQRHLRLEDYRYGANLHPVVTILSGRGCPYRCHWCVYPQVMTGQHFRARSPENFVGELAWIAGHLPQVREVFVEDDTFSANRSRVHAICALIRARGLRLRWACNVRPDLDRETLAAMKAAGCRMVLAGFESGNQGVLDHLGKGIRLEPARQFVRDARAIGLVLHACFVAGGPGETRTTLAQSLEYALGLDVTTAQFCPIMVYPGTRAYEWARTGGYLASTDFAQWVTAEGTHNCQVSTPELSAAEITAFCDYARRRFYLRPRYVLRTALWTIRRPAEWPRMWRGARSLLYFLRRYGKHAPA